MQDLSNTFIMHVTKTSLVHFIFWDKIGWFSCLTYQYKIKINISLLIGLRYKFALGRKTAGNWPCSQYACLVLRLLIIHQKFSKVVSSTQSILPNSMIMRYIFSFFLIRHLWLITSISQHKATQIWFYTSERTCSDLLYKLPNFIKFHEFNRNSYDHVAEGCIPCS